jgi:flagellar biosynthesis protein
MKYNKQHKIAVALEYDGRNAPLVTAKGIGDVADKILQIAKQQGIPLQQDMELVEILSQIDLGDEIPENLYRAVAEVISFAYIIRGKFPENFKPDSY